MEKKIDRKLRVGYVGYGRRGYGGGDPVLLNDIFGTPEYDPLHRAASYVDGAMSILTGIAANKSIATGMPVNINDLVKF